MLAVDLLLIDGYHHLCLHSRPCSVSGPLRQLSPALQQDPQVFVGRQRDPFPFVCKRQLFCGTPWLRSRMKKLSMEEKSGCSMSAVL